MSNSLPYPLLVGSARVVVEHIFSRVHSASMLSMHFVKPTTSAVYSGACMNFERCLCSRDDQVCSMADLDEILLYYFGLLFEDNPIREERQKAVNTYIYV